MENSYDDYRKELSEAAASLSKSSPLSYAEAIKVLSEARAQIGQPQPPRTGPSTIGAARAFINGKMAMDDYGRSMAMNAALPAIPPWYPRIEKESTPGSPPPLNRDGPDQWFRDLLYKGTIDRQSSPKAQPPLPVEEPLPTPVTVHYKRLIRE